MKVILSYPYSGCLYWWFAKERSPALSRRRTGHSYYDFLFGNVERHLDIALACALIYEDFVIPPADAISPGFGDLRHFTQTDLGIEVSEWDFLAEAHRVVEPVKESWQSDPLLTTLLGGKSDIEVSMELEYAVADVLLANEYDADVICSDGRRAVIRRLVELGIITASLEDKSVSHLVDSYTKVTGLTFGVDGVRRFIDLKWMAPLREYADSFRKTVENPSMRSTEDLYVEIAKAMESITLAEHIGGTFEATSQVMNMAGVVPGIGNVASLVSIGSSAGAVTARNRAKRARWVELSGAVLTARNRLALEDELRRRGLL